MFQRNEQHILGMTIEQGQVSDYYFQSKKTYFSHYQPK